MKKKLMKLLPLLLLVLTLVFTTNTANAAEAAKSGSNYTLTDDGVLTIKNSSFKWSEIEDYDTKYSITKIVFSGNVTVVTRQIMNESPSSIKEIVLQSGVTSIGDNAFDSSALTEIICTGTTPATGISQAAFSSCSKIDGYYPASGLAAMKKINFSDVTITWHEYGKGKWYFLNP